VSCEVLTFSWRSLLLLLSCGNFALYVDISVSRNLPLPYSDWKTFMSWWWRQQVSLMRKYLSAKLHGVTFKKMICMYRAKYWWDRKIFYVGRVAMLFMIIMDWAMLRLYRPLEVYVGPFILTVLCRFIWLHAKKLFGIGAASIRRSWYFHCDSDIIIMAFRLKAYSSYPILVFHVWSFLM
jgi:hypothetical protein